MYKSPRFTRPPILLRVEEAALLWIAHIAIDRLLGFGLKYPTHFKDTHLQHIPTRSSVTP